ncbi:H1_5 [Acanthosepion pharaonis]|uniref:H1_5 n=1 Tax=Acanthosepion pharaonis TaxID=158019 RepID=A0A812DK45_ACAPH|nr:H1_5 [Sepia pharaonis]
MADTETAAAAAPAPAKTKKASKPKKASSHPPYGQMIKDAITDLKERGGSSRQAIQKYLTTHFKVPADGVSSAQLKLALKRGVTSGQLKQCKGTGASGSFKVGEKKTEKKPKAKSKKPAKKAAAKKPKSPKKTAKPKKVAAKKAKKPKVAKPAAKKAKSPKKAKKTAAKKTAKPKSKAAKKSKK